ncbi:proline-rich acidic protein 1 [Echinops telfairi]|uniref:Proline-rich acidic protein 1 n=1 Tax=Echinops telfairi TaxID=9371 RepID=A0AC55D5Y9_ECHTE|nr:proline-rich acidic protein 1 [Echinops telfairi]
MRRLILVVGLLAAVLQEAGTILPAQVSAKFKERDQVSEQDTEEAWAVKAVERPEKEDRLEGLFPRLKSPTAADTAENWHGDKAWVEDLLSRVRSPLQGPEPDRDSLYHAEPEEGLDMASWSRARLFFQLLQGPEEDRDHIYHSEER